MTFTFLFCESMTMFSFNNIYYLYPHLSLFKFPFLNLLFCQYCGSWMDLCVWITSPRFSIVDQALCAARVIPDLICFMSLLYSKWPSPRYAVKHIALSFLPPSIHSFSLSHSLSPSSNLYPTLLFPLRETFGSMEQFQNHLWDCVMWCWQRMLIGLSEGLLLSLRRSTAIPVCLLVLL